ncbi:TPA: hypothetical protein ACGO1A_000224 [Streptococcus suis]
MIKFIKRYPEQAFLLLYNAGIFVWLQSTSSAIVRQLGLTTDWLEKIPVPLRAMAGSSLTGMDNLLNSSAWGWLFVSMILMLIVRFVKGLIKFLILLIIIGGGLYLVWQHWELLQGFVN